MITRLITIISCCFFLFSTQKAQAQSSKFVPGQLILTYPVGTMTAQKLSSLLSGKLPNGISASVIDSSDVLGSFLIDLPGLSGDIDPCSIKINELIQSACPKCPKPSGTSGTGVLGGGFNYYTQSDIVSGKATQSEAWTKKWDSIIKNGEKGCLTLIAFSDSGVDKAHFAGTPQFDRTDVTNVSSFTSPFDENGHGTHVVGITANIVQNYTSINLLSIRTQDEFGEGTVWDAIKSIEIAIEKKARVHNLSIAYFQVCDDKEDSPLKNAMQIAGEEHNLLFVTAAGNHFHNLRNDDSYRIYPSMFNLPYQINVAALDDNNQLADQGIWGTNYGVEYVNLGADGVGIHSSVLNREYGIAGGSSMAAAHVTAVAGIIASRNCDIRNTEIRECILGTTRGGDLDFSTHGYLDPQAAIDCKNSGEHIKDRSANKYLTNTAQHDFDISPNPFSDVLNLRFEANNENEATQYALYNFTGQLIQQNEYKGSINTTWNLVNLPQGIYLLKIQHEGTQEIQKLIKQ